MTTKTKKPEQPHTLEELASPGQFGFNYDVCTDADSQQFRSACGEIDVDSLPAMRSDPEENAKKDERLLL